MQRDLSEYHTTGDILVVDYAAATLALLSRLLGGAGHTVREAADGELALWLAQSRPPELILLGIGAPGNDGFELCRRLRQAPALEHVPVMLTAARHDAGDALRGFGLGAVDFIAAPFQADETLARIAVHLRLGRARRQLAEQRARLEQHASERSAELEQVAATLAQEVCARRASEQLLRLSGQVFEATRDAIVITDADGVIVTTNPAFGRVTGYEAAEVLGWNALRLAADQDDSLLFRSIARSLRGAGHWSGEVLARRKGGDTCAGLLNLSAAPGAHGEVGHYIGVFMDITERKAEQHLIRFLSYHDALTGLPNRQLAAERFEQIRATARRDGQCVVVMCLDLDRFKSINDSFGPQVGDKALQVVARFLTSCVRDSDTVARHGGDEFQIILQDDAHFSATLAAAQRILAGLRDGQMINGQRMTLSTSIGIAVCPDDGDSLEELARNADTALCRAKETGRDNYAFFTERMDIDIREKLAIQNQLRGAIERREFAVHYQPQMCLRSGAMLGAEALLRWDNPALGKVPPNVFVPLAEEYGLITAIGEWVLETVCAQIRCWQDAGLGAIKVAVNLSASQFAQDRTVQFVEATLAANGIAAGCLGIEITEGTVMGDPHKAALALGRLKDIGVGISLDDFGTGYSSLSYLKRFPIDVLKIDKSFVDDVTSSADDAAIALSVISLAHNLNMRVIAEGVETRAQLAFLTEHGCDEMQGYLFSRPVPVEVFTALLREKKNLRDV
jgi:diguanylate cyclase (GGDEF)-like protein/PAS domain S-box-containing protein